MSATLKSPDEKLSPNQRDRMLEFIGQSAAVIGGTDLDKSILLTDPQIVVTAMKCAVILGYQEQNLEEFFRREFRIAGITEGDLGGCAEFTSLMNIERRIRVAAGGMN